MPTQNSLAAEAQHWAAAQNKITTCRPSKYYYIELARHQIPQTTETMSKEAYLNHTHSKAFSSQKNSRVTVTYIILAPEWIGDLSLPLQTQRHMIFDNMISTPVNPLLVPRHTLKKFQLNTDDIIGVERKQIYLVLRSQRYTDMLDCKK